MRARLPQGMGKGPSGNMNQMLRQAQEMQVKINGKREVLDLKIKPEVVDPADVEMLQDLIMSAFNEAVHNLDEVSDKEMSALTGGVSFPGLF